MTNRNWIFAIALFAASFPAVGAGNEGITLSHFEPLRAVEIRSGSGTGDQKPGSIGPIELRFDALGHGFDLLLKPNANLLAAIGDGPVAGDVVPYRGRLAGIENSWARIVVSRGVPTGLVFDGTDLYALEAPGDAIVATETPIIYRLADVVIAPGALSCATGDAAMSGAAMFKALVSDLGTGIAQAPGAISEINIGAIGDFEFFSQKGANASSAILTRLNNVDGIYSEQLGIQINVPVIEIFEDVNDPFSDTGNPGSLLGELADYRFATPVQKNQGLTHLYTGRSLDGTTVGIAYRGALCNGRYGAGLSEGSNDAGLDSLVAAHEIGHNFGAPHDGEDGSACMDQQGAWLMSPSINGSDQFSPCSIQQMQDDIAGAACITALPGTDISLAFRDSGRTLLLGATENVIVDVISNGTDDAQNVVATVSLPTNVTLVSATSGAGSCSSGAGSVVCQLGVVAGGSATEIDLMVIATSVGTDTFAADVTADVDDRADNNADSLPVTVDPAVNLVINALPAAQATLDGSTTVTATFDNLAVLDATGVTLSISLNAGLRADSASWTIGTCNVAPQQVDCQANLFDRQSSATLTLGVTGIAEGTKHYTVTLASAEADADTSDNSVQGSVRVSTAGGGSDESGSGSTGWMLLVLLAALTLRRNRLISCRAG